MTVIASICPIVSVAGFAALIRGESDHKRRTCHVRKPCRDRDRR